VIVGKRAIRICLETEDDRLALLTIGFGVNRSEHRDGKRTKQSTLRQSLIVLFKIDKLLNLGNSKEFVEFSSTEP
jgi:hypothetical protein